MNSAFFLFPFLFGAAFLFILIAGGMTFFNANRIFRIVMKSAEQRLNQSENPTAAPVSVQSRTPVGSPLKCSNCGAGLDEPEDSADGKLRCAYCHEWTTV
jgi:hypothetical protein